MHLLQQQKIELLLCEKKCKAFQVSSKINGKKGNKLPDHHQKEWWEIDYLLYILKKYFIVCDDEVPIIIESFSWLFL